MNGVKVRIRTEKFAPTFSFHVAVLQRTTKEMYHNVCFVAFSLLLPSLLLKLPIGYPGICVGEGWVACVDAGLGGHLSRSSLILLLTVSVIKEFLVMTTLTELTVLTEVFVGRRKEGRPKDPKLAKQENEKSRGVEKRI